MWRKDCENISNGCSGNQCQTSCCVSFSVHYTQIRTYVKKVGQRLLLPSTIEYITHMAIISEAQSGDWTFRNTQICNLQD